MELPSGEDRSVHEKMNGKDGGVAAISKLVDVKAETLMEKKKETANTTSGSSPLSKEMPAIHGGGGLNSINDSLQAKKSIGVEGEEVDATEKSSQKSQVLVGTGTSGPEPSKTSSVSNTAVDPTDSPFLQSAAQAEAEECDPSIDAMTASNPDSDLLEHPRPLPAPQIQQPSRPGAYSNYPGGESYRLQPTSASALTSIDLDEYIETAENTPGILAVSTTPNSSTFNSNNENAGLAEARLVAEECHVPMTVAQEEVGKSDTSQRTKNLFWFVLAGLAGISLFVVFILWLSGVFDKDSDNSKQVDNTQNNSSDINRVAYLKSFLPQDTLKDVEGDRYSSQAQAFQWLLSDPQLLNYNQLRIHQRFALATFYYATQGDLWRQDDNWLSYDHHECQWGNTYGYATGESIFSLEALKKPPCDDDLDTNNSTEEKSGGVFRRLWFLENNLQGSIPRELYLLPQLESITFSAKSNITGPIPSQFGLLSKLQYFKMGGDLSGSLPSEIGNLGDLNVFLVRGIGDNNMTGSIPTQLGQLTNLQRFGFSHFKHVGGALPSEIGLLTDLVSFDVIETSVSGTLPTEFGLLSSLLFTWLSGNSLSGTINPELGQALSQNMWLALNDNQFTGHIPSEFGLMAGTQELSLARNLLESTLPTELGQLDRMYSLDISENFLTGRFHPEALNMSSIKILQMSNNGFTGTIPAIVGSLETLDLLDMSNNALTGEFPPIGDLPLLTEILLQGNNISGSLPKEFSSNVTLFNVSGNELLIGSIPNSLCSLNQSFFSFDCSDQLCGCSECECT